MPKIKIVNKSEEAEITPVVSILNGFTVSGIEVQSRCGGKGNCGLCRIKLVKGGEFMSPLSEREIVVLKKESIDKGVRLACQSYASQDVEIILPLSEEEVEKIDEA